MTTWQSGSKCVTVALIPFLQHCSRPWASMLGRLVSTTFNWLGGMAVHKVCGSSSCNPVASGHVSQLGLAFSTPVRFRDKLWSDNKTTGVSHFQIQISPIVGHKDTCHVSTFLPPHFQINSYIDMLSFCEPKKISRFPGNISLFRISGKIGWGAKQLVGKQSDNNQAGAVSDWGQHENSPSNQHDSSR